jgi:hypothetical protein
MPRHRKKTAVKPTSGMPQTRQLAASGGVLISKGALIATHFISSRRRVHVKTDQTRPVTKRDSADCCCLIIVNQYILTTDS